MNVNSLFFHFFHLFSAHTPLSLSLPIALALSLSLSLSLRGGETPAVHVTHPSGSY